MRLHICPLAQGFHPSSELCFGRVRKRRFQCVRARGGRRQVRRTGRPGEYSKPKSPYFREVRFKRLRRKLFGFESGDERSQFGRRKVCGRDRHQSVPRKERGHQPSGISVTAHPPPPAPVNFVARLYGSAPVIRRTASKDGCETPS